MNKARVAADRRPANCIWLWGEGKRPALRPFEALYGIKGGMVSAVDLLKGIANCAGMEVAEVPGHPVILTPTLRAKPRRRWIC